MRRVLLAAAAIAVLVPASAQAADRFNSAPYRQAVTVPNILQHEFQLQQIADRNGGTRLAGTPGNDQTVNYVARTMRDAGWKVRKQPFQFPFFIENGTPTFKRTAPTPRTFAHEDEFVTMDFGLG
jgi:hypothetical protein